VTSALGTLIVGFGRAGRELHLRGVLAAREAGAPGFARDAPVVVVDALVPPRTDIEGVVRANDLPPADGRTVAHLCTPPDDRPGALSALAEAGYRQVICEKPLARAEVELERILVTAEAFGLDLLVSGPWLSSALTRRLTDVLGRPELGVPRHQLILQRKPRFSRTLAQRHDQTAFDVELPHAVALALLLAGDPVAVIAAGSEDMCVDGVRLPGMGGAWLELLHRDGRRTSIRSDLCAPVRQRSVVVRCEAAVVRGDFPVSGDDHYAQLVIRDHDGELLERERMLDPGLDRFLLEAYAHFVGRGPRPLSDLTRAAPVVSVLAEARTRSGLPLAPPAAAEALPGMAIA
jgi:predicted dehydrogenase